MVNLILGDCLDELKELENNSVDSIVTDPPYGLSAAPNSGKKSKGGFMGKMWDYDVPSVDIWRECLRVLKPGGHLLAFAGTRTQHRMAVNIEDAGFEIRDMIAWVYGSGFPKSLNIGKAVDKLQGNEREVMGYAIRPDGSKPRVNVKARSAQFGNSDSNDQRPTKGNSQWEGWGTALKPALEPITVARKPFKGTVAENVLKHGTGALNIDASRIPTNENITIHGSSVKSNTFSQVKPCKPFQTNGQKQGRFPANLIHDGSDEVVGLFPVTTSGGSGSTKPKAVGANCYGKYNQRIGGQRDGDTGSAARFFYCAKANKKDRDEGCEGLPLGEPPASARSKPADGRQNALGNPRSNHHPTVKPTDLMRYLCRLVTPPTGVVLDPFMGSGTTGKAARIEGFGFIGIERDVEYYEMSKRRINNALQSSIARKLNIPTEETKELINKFF